MISFCTQILNRWWQLQHTLMSNIKALEGTNHEWVILDLGSDDDIHIPDHPNVRYIKIDRPSEYHIAMQKNAVMKMAQGDYIFTLDADNFISSDLISFIQRHKNQAIHDYNHNLQGTWGRIGAPKWAMEAVHFHPQWPGSSLHDTELVSRLKSVVEVCEPGKRCLAPAPIKNDISDTTLYTPGKLNWKDWETINTNTMKKEAFVPSMHIQLPANTLMNGWLKERIYSWGFSGTLRYAAKFSNDFDFAAGGKLPGIAGGNAPKWGKADIHGFSARVMWRNKGESELYVYRYGNIQESFPLGLKFKPGRWHNIEFTFNNSNVELNIDDKVVKVDVGYSRCQKVLYHVYRGGRTDEFKSKSGGFVEIKGVNNG